MGMPKIQIKHIDRHIALNNIMASIALQEAALSHILNADGEKLQLAVALTDPTGSGFTGRYTAAENAMADLLTVNESVDGLVSTVGTMESVLRSKLNNVLNYINPSLNLVVRRPVPVTLVDSGGAPVVGAVILAVGVTDAGQPVHEEYTTGAGGKVTMMLAPGTYTITQESLAPITRATREDIKSPDVFTVTVTDFSHSILNSDGEAVSEIVFEQAEDTGLRGPEPAGPGGGGEARDDTYDDSADTYQAAPPSLPQYTPPPAAAAAPTITQPTEAAETTEEVPSVPIRVSAANGADGEGVQGVQFRIRGNARSERGTHKVAYDLETDANGVIEFDAPANSEGTYSIQPARQTNGINVLRGTFSIKTDDVGHIAE